MTKNPILNALLASLYIGVIVYGVNLVAGPGPDKDIGPIMGVLMISLFTLSAAVMGMIFFYQPFRMYFDGEKQQAVTLIIKTIVTFAVITAVLAGLVLGLTR